jgi:flagellar secretion chaperone FliS
MYLSKGGAGQYQQIQIEAQHADASRHKLVNLMLSRIIARLTAAQAAISQKNINNRNNEINSTIDIIAALKSALDVDRGGDLAGNLFDLYTYAETSLMDANKDSSMTKIQEIKNIFIQIQEAWDQIPAAERDK